MLEINDESLVGYPPVSGDLSKNSFFNFSVFHKYKRTLFGVLNSYKMRIKKLVYGTMKPSKIGGGFMNQYNIIVQQLLAYLTKRKQCSSSRLSHKQCYEEFGQYLEENNLYPELFIQ